MLLSEPRLGVVYLYHQIHTNLHNRESTSSLTMNHKVSVCEYFEEQKLTIVVPPTLGRVYTQHVQTPGPGRNRYNRLTMPPHELMNDDEQRDTSFAIHTDSRGRAINNVRGHVPTTASNNLTQPVRRPQHNAYSALYPPNSGLVIPQQSADGSPVTNLANAMFYNQPLPLLQRPLPADNFYQLSQPPQHISNFKHLQYQHSTITPFNQSEFFSQKNA